MKITKEINALVEPGETELDQLRIISEQLDRKLKVFNNLDCEIVPGQDIRRRHLTKNCLDNWNQAEIKLMRLSRKKIRIVEP